MYNISKIGPEYVLQTQAVLTDQTVLLLLRINYRWRLQLANTIKSNQHGWIIKNVKYAESAK